MARASVAVSTILAIVMLIIAALASTLILYGWSMELSTILPKGSREYAKLVITEHVTGSSILTLYIKNVGGSLAVIDKVYLEGPKDVFYELEIASIQGTGVEGELWGGDVWRVDASSLTLRKARDGKVLYDVFTSRDPSTWNDSYVDHNNDWGHVYYDPDGLKLLSRSAGGWAVRGFISQGKIIDLGDLPIVVEVDLQKTYYNVPDGDAAASPFAACLYLSSSKKRNPYYATPWFAAKLYPRGSPTDRTEAQLVTRDSNRIVTYKTLYTWYSSPNSQPRGIFLLVFNETNRVYYYFWRNTRSGSPYAVGSWSSPGLTQVFSSSPLYVYLTIDNKVKVSSRKVHVRYLQVYRGTSIVVNGLKPGWTVQLYDENDQLIKEVLASSNSVEIDLLDYVVEYGMPFKGYIKVVTCDMEEIRSYGGAAIAPGETKPVTLSIKGVPHGVYTLKVVAKDGALTVMPVKI